MCTIYYDNRVKIVMALQKYNNNPKIISSQEYRIMSSIWIKALPTLIRKLEKMLVKFENLEVPNKNFFLMLNSLSTDIKNLSVLVTEFHRITTDYLTPSDRRNLYG